MFGLLEMKRGQVYCQHLSLNRNAMLSPATTSCHSWNPYPSSELYWIPIFCTECLNIDSLCVLRKIWSGELCMFGWMHIESSTSGWSASSPEAQRLGSATILSKPHPPDMWYLAQKNSSCGCKGRIGNVLLIHPLKSKFEFANSFPLQPCQLEFFLFKKWRIQVRDAEAESSSAAMGGTEQPCLPPVKVAYRGSSPLLDHF